MSIEPELFFSDIKITLQYRRKWLGSGTMKTVECIKSWPLYHNVATVDNVGLSLDTAVVVKNKSQVPLNITDDIESHG